MTETFYDSESMGKFLDALYNYLPSSYDGKNVTEVRVRIGKSMGQKWYMVVFEPVFHCFDTKFWNNVKISCME